jgi:hypothetical protein
MKKSLGAKTLVYPAPVFVVGTYDSQGKPNVMTASWGGICCSQPPCVAVSLRKATYTYGNIVERKAFTISIPSEVNVAAADHFGLVSGRDEDKFATAKLTPVRSDLVDAPYVKEFPMIVEYAKKRPKSKNSCCCRRKCQFFPNRRCRSFGGRAGSSQGAVEGVAAGHGDDVLVGAASRPKTRDAN